ncbi:MAG: hypothetical protein M0R17_04755 [Candidatus Omnitrophica bacterium]|jgi:hypothetical protein|nr:hypothetical protein [Candidatus Omnitrophota bacterium]
MAKVKEEVKEYAIIAKLKENMGKSIEDLYVEQSIDSLEDTIIGCNEQISHYKTSRIPSAENAIKRAEREVIKAKKELDNVENSIARNYETYVDNCKVAEKKLDKADLALSETKSNLQFENDCLAKHEYNLAKLTATV